MASISFILCTHNPSLPRLNRVLGHIAAQGGGLRPDFELVVVDDPFGDVSRSRFHSAVAQGRLRGEEMFQNSAPA